MKGTPVLLDGSLTSKPTWWNTSSVFRHVGFFVCASATKRLACQWGINIMITSDSNRAQQIAKAASVFEQKRTGHAPRSVSVVMSKSTLVITLEGALSPAEKALARNPAAASQLQEYHRKLFAASSGTLCREINDIIGVSVRKSGAEVETVTGAMMQMFASGTVVQVFLLNSDVPSETWSGVG